MCGTIGAILTAILLSASFLGTFRSNSDTLSTTRMRINFTIAEDFRECVILVQFTLCRCKVADDRGAGPGTGV